MSPPHEGNGHVPPISMPISVMNEQEALSRLKAYREKYLGQTPPDWVAYESGQLRDRLNELAVQAQADARVSFPEPIPASQLKHAHEGRRLPTPDDLAQWRASVAQAKVARAQAPDEVPAGFRFEPMDSADFDALDCRPTWLVKRLLVKGQPAVIGGPQKSLKTSVAIDLAVSLASATPFLGELGVYKKVRVAVLSGESGQWALQSLARRVCDARGVGLADLANMLLWQTTLPRLADPGDLSRLASGLACRGVVVVVIDPLYLALLAGAAGVQASNLFDVGPLLLAAARACLDVGCTPVLVHHTTKPSNASRDPLQLSDLAFAGLPEFARQWLLINRREVYKPPDAHKLWLSAGGSCGQGGLWALDVDEGELGEHFGGRKWDVIVRTAGDEIEVRKQIAEMVKRKTDSEKETAEDARFLRSLDLLDPGRRGVGLTALRNQAGLSSDRANAVRARLRGQEIVEDAPVEVKVGNGATRTCDGVRRRVENDQP